MKTHRASPDCAAYHGFSLLAEGCVTGTDREGLERLCRYVSRPAIATEGLSELADGRIAYDLRHRWTDGTTRVVVGPLNFHEKLAVTSGFVSLGLRWGAPRPDRIWAPLFAFRGVGTLGRARRTGIGVGTSGGGSPCPPP